MSVLIKPRIIELLTSRICHDLISPVGAINNGVELMEEFGDDDDGEALGLVKSSAKKSDIHLRCFRLAYGAAGTSRDVKPQDVKSLMNEWTSLTKVRLDWVDSSAYTSVLTPVGYLKCLMNVMIFAGECLGLGGILRVEVKDSDPFTIKVSCLHDRLTLKSETFDALDGDIEEEKLDARSIQGYVTRMFCETYNATLTYDKTSETEISFTLTARE